MKPAILLLFRWPFSVGYAIAPLQRAFYEAAIDLVPDRSRIGFALPGEDGFRPDWVDEHSPVIAFDSSTRDRAAIARFADFVGQHGFTTLLGFDQPPRMPYYRAARSAGIRRLISYWGAPMSSLNSGLKLALKRIEVMMLPDGPDCYAFESEGMRDTAVRGRGVPVRTTRIVRLGVDHRRFQPESVVDLLVHDRFVIPRDRRIAVFAGHMEERKGVSVIIEAAIELVDGRAVDDLHFLLLGNQPGEEQRFLAMLRGSKAATHVTFGGYVRDIERILPACDIGIIASTGWDSFTLTSLEMAACGLPLLVSDLPGLREAVIDGETGMIFRSGNSGALADGLQRITADENSRARMSRAARIRIEQQFTLEIQHASLVDLLRGPSA